mmetsp:Transcript_8845/g.38969  ORF Transcript_8845/g.38969 Transcript_8845/m.38969 type:complete len:238 (+) Transcript_8845:336-1049(+)
MRRVPQTRRPHPLLRRVLPKRPLADAQARVRRTPPRDRREEDDFADARPRPRRRRRRGREIRAGRRDGGPDADVVQPGVRGEGRQRAGRGSSGRSRLARLGHVRDRRGLERARVPPRVARARVRDERGGVSRDGGAIRCEGLRVMAEGRRALSTADGTRAPLARMVPTPSREDERVRREFSRRRHASPRVAASHGVRASESHREGFRVREGVHGGRDSRRDAVRHSRRAGVSRPFLR